MLGRRLRRLDLVLRLGCVSGGNGLRLALPSGSSAVWQIARIYQGEKMMGRVKRGWRHSISLITLLVVATGINHFTADWVISLLGLPAGSVKDWLETSYFALLLVGGIFLADLLNRDDSGSGS